MARLVHFLLLLVLAAAAQAQAQGQGQQKRNGEWWRSLDETARVFYVAGFMAARASDVVVFPVLICQLESKEHEAVMSCARRHTDFLSSKPLGRLGTSGMSVGQVMDGVGSFYDDYRNRRIDVNAAVNAVAMSISGTPASEVSDFVERLRRIADN